VKRLTSRVTGYLPNLSSWLSRENTETDGNHVDIAEAAEEATNTFRNQNSEQAAPPQKRARTDFITPENQPNFSDTNNLSISTIQHDLGNISSFFLLL
jgi:hypothetical protein